MTVTPFLMLMEESDSQISSPDNKPLIFYLRQYEKRFRDFTDQLEFDASYLMSILDSPDYRDVLYKEKFESFDARKGASGKCLSGQTG